MKNHSYISMQQDMLDQGQLQVTVLDSASNRPVENATVRISYTGVPDNVIEEIRTDSSGKTPMLELAAPPLEYSMKPVEQQPYAEYTVRISAEVSPIGPSWTTIYSGITTLFNTISPVSFIGLISASGFLGGYSPKSVWGPITIR